MMTYWEDFGYSQVMEAALDDSFTFLGCFMLCVWADVGSSRGLKADLNDGYMFLSSFFCRPRSVLC